MYSLQKAANETQLSKIKGEDQKVALKQLMVIISTLKYLVGQGLTIRGHKNDFMA